jgi:beta-glucosidase
MKKKCLLVLAALGAVLVLLALGCQFNPMGPEKPESPGEPQEKGLLDWFGLGGSTPSPFLWGVATSGYQTEGFLNEDDDHTQWREWVSYHRPPLVAVGAGTGFYVGNMYETDIINTAAMGAKAFRISIEWARLEPEPGTTYDFSFYDNVIQKIIDNGMEPVVTLLHFTYPDWIEGDYGWEKPGRIFPPQLPPAVQAYLDFVDTVVNRYKDKVKYWITFNEPNTWVPAGWLLGVNPPGETNLRASIQVARNVIQAHRLAYDRIHRIYGDWWRPRKTAQVSANIYCLSFQPLPAAFDSRSFQADWVYPAIIDKVDYVSLDYYFSFHSIQDALGVYGQPWLYPSEPGGLHDAIMQYWGRYHKPIFITENGMATYNGTVKSDATPSEYLNYHVAAMQQAQIEGAKVIGYLYWSITDNWEWGEYDARFGLYTVHYGGTQPPREATEAVDTYAGIIAEAAYQAQPAP